MTHRITSGCGAGVAALAAIVALAVVAGCKEVDREGTPLGQTSSGATLEGEGGERAAASTGAGSAADQTAACPLNKTVSEPDKGAPEHVVAKLYEAALGPDSEKSFQKFYSHFLPKHDRKWVRRQYWTRIRQHVDKYVTNEEPVTFKICREKKGSDGSVKMFIKSNDPKKSNPPITVIKRGTHWKVDYFSY